MIHIPGPVTEDTPPSMLTPPVPGPAVEPPDVELPGPPELEVPELLPPEPELLPGPPGAAVGVVTAWVVWGTVTGSSGMSVMVLPPELLPPGD